MTTEELDLQQPERITDVRTHHGDNIILLYATARRVGINLYNLPHNPDLPSDVYGHLQLLTDDLIEVIREENDPDYERDTLGETQEDEDRFREAYLNLFRRFLLVPEETEYIVGPLPDVLCAGATLGCHCENYESMRLEEAYTRELMGTLRMAFGYEVLQEIQIPHIFTDDSQVFRFVGFRIQVQYLRRLFGGLGNYLEERDVETGVDLCDMDKSEDGEDAINTRELLYNMSLILRGMETKTVLRILREQGILD